MNKELHKLLLNGLGVFTFLACTYVGLSQQESWKKVLLPIMGVGLGFLFSQLAKGVDTVSPKK